MLARAAPFAVGAVLALGALLVVRQAQAIARRSDALLDTDMRVVYTVYKLSPAGLKMLERLEGLKLARYPDGAGYSIGYGHFIRPGENLTTITMGQARELLENDVRQVEAAVNDLVDVAITQWQFDALVMLAYNIGTDQDEDTIAEGLGDSTLLRLLNAGDRAGAAQQFGEWVKVRRGSQKVIEAGLVARRAKEGALFASGVYA